MPVRHPGIWLGTNRQNHQAKRRWSDGEGMHIATPGRPITLVEESAPWWFSALLPLYVIVVIPYLVWRVDFLRVDHIWFMGPLLIADLFNALITGLHLFLNRRLLHPVWVPPLPGRSVDAFIPTYNESSDMVEMTALGALRIHGIRNVFILDDGARKHIEELAARIGAVYLARHDNAHAKAGNMNFGLTHSDAEFLLYFDCDHVPQASFIQRTLGYFQDDRLAFVQTPQTFYNFRSSIQFRRLPGKNLWHEQTMFYDVIQPAKNRFNAAFFCGSGAIFRRSALDVIGGFATETATEDIHTSLKLHAAGWRSLFLSEVLAYGTAPEDFKEYHDQRVRWGAGSLGLMFRSGDSPLVKRGLTIGQRLCYFSSTNHYFYSGVVKFFYLALPILMIVLLPFLAQEDRAYSLAYLWFAFPFYLLSVAIAYLQSRKAFHLIYSEQFNLAVIPACLVALKAIVNVRKKLKVSIKRKSVKENPFAYTFILILAGIMGAGNVILVAYWVVGLERSFDVTQSRIIVPALFWNTFNLAFLLSTIAYLREFSSRPHSAHPFHPPNSPVALWTGESGHLESISFQGAQMRLDAFPTWPRVQLHVSTLDGPILLDGEVIRRQTINTANIVDVTFCDLNVTQKKRLTRFFFDEIVPWHFSQEVADRARDATQSSLAPTKLPTPRAQPWPTSNSRQRPPGEASLERW